MLIITNCQKIRSFQPDQIISRRYLNYKCSFIIMMPIIVQSVKQINLTYCSARVNQLQFYNMKALLLIALLVCLSVSYDEKWAILQAKFSAITHCSTAQIEAWNCKLCKEYPHLTSVSQIQNNLTHISGFVGYDSLRNTIVVAWRGTVDAVNWIQDLDFKQEPYQGSFKCVNCRIHSGFFNAYYSVSGRVKDKVQQLLAAHPTATISLTGHSLGGALSQVAALFLIKDYPSKIESLYNYGSTRLGNGPLSAYIHLIVPQLYRIVHSHDLVPHYPPIDFNYLHAPFEVFYNDDFSSYKICNDSGEDRDCSDKLAPNYNMNDHTFYWVKTDSSVC